MKTKALLVSLCMLLAVDGFCQLKVVEKSQKKKPAWVGGVQSEYIITMAIAGDLETAKNQTLQQVKQQVISSVAENVQMGTSSTIAQQTTNEGITSFLDTFTSSFSTQSANVPYLKGISTAGAEDYYWEKRKDKKTKLVSYLYAIKYPFPAVERKRLAYEFEKRDAEMVAKYEILKKELTTVQSVEQIGMATTELDPLISYFFDNTRKEAARNLQSSYSGLYDNVTFQTISSEPGEYVFALTLNGREIAVSQRPVLKSECATQLAAKTEGTRVKVTYDYENCALGEENPISITYKLGTRQATNTFYVDMKSLQPPVTVKGTMIIRASSKDENSIGDLAIRVDVEAREKGSYKIEALELTIPGISDLITVENIGRVIGQGSYTLNLMATGTFEMTKPLNSRQEFLKGRITVKTDKGEKRSEFRVPFKPNW